MITPTTPILGAGGTRQDVLAYLQRKGIAPSSECWSYLMELERLCALTGVSFIVAASQSAHETADWTSERFVRNRNPAGLAVESDDDPDPATFTGEEAARVHVWALLVAVDANTDDFEMLPAFPDSARPFAARWVVKYNDPNIPTVVTVADLQRRYTDAAGEHQATWAWDEQYARKLSDRANAIFGVKETPETYTTSGASKGRDAMPTLTFGKVPYPAVYPRHLPLSNPYIKAGAPDVPEAVFWHRMIGTLWGTDGHFYGGNAATAYGVGVTSIDGADDAGRIIEWISRESGRYGESSGPAYGPYGDGAKLIAQVGVGGVNRNSKAIEISGNYDTPLDEPAREAIVNLTAYFADQRRIPWDQFPIVPGTDRSFVCWHAEITGDAYKVCPGAVVRAETSALIARVAQRLKEYQVGGTVQKPPQYAAPDLPDWWDRSLEQSRPNDAKDGDVLWRVVRRNVEALKRTQRFSAPDTKAAKSGPPTQVREKVFVERVGDVPYTDAKGRAKTRQWLITDDGHYLLASGFSPRIAIQAR